MHRWAVVTLAAAAIAILGVAGQGSDGGKQAEASHVNPILFVHGFTSSASAWNTMKPRFQADGWESNYLMAISYNSYQSNVTIANTIASSVNTLKANTGAAKVDIVTHSMGGLSTRYYLKNLGGTANVDDWVSLAGPNHGTVWAAGCFFLTPCAQMIPGSSFLNALNSGDETPGSVNYGTWWSSCDEIITPDESVILNGATNTHTSCILHSQMLTDLTVYNGVKAFVQ
jgi:triacylglycerol lipase